MSRSAAIQWCSVCQEYKPCRSLSPSEFWGGFAENGHGHNFSRTNHEDIRYYRRYRKCKDCGNEFETAEIEIYFLDQLVRLREEAKKLKHAIENLDTDVASSQTAVNHAVDKLMDLRQLLMTMKE